MPRQKKEWKNLNLKLDAQVSDRLEDYVNETGLTKTAALERILTQYFDEREKKVRELKENNVL